MSKGNVFSVKKNISVLKQWQELLYLNDDFSGLTKRSATEMHK